MHELGFVVRLAQCLDTRFLELNLVLVFLGHLVEFRAHVRDRHQGFVFDQFLKFQHVSQIIPHCWLGSDLDWGLKSKVFVGICFHIPFKHSCGFCRHRLSRHANDIVVYKPNNLELVVTDIVRV